MRLEAVKDIQREIRSQDLVQVRRVCARPVHRIKQRLQLFAPLGNAGAIINAPAYRSARQTGLKPPRG